ncbi:MULTISPECIES: hypothetical protein [Kitasatospora]|uniref:DUF7919 domain-containing protein n=1 Tax=Kitasatospora setae (strain ATCC 33774 / DSM 43861 / JCM 3304 / KCC A-0304 / NBRC 14216 / KM-6054) TaxID=452652 RepID=E4NIR5_KITSK|nr:MULTISPECIES: hypothetical protein [Kitasatospora]BAJ32863.1 hypothetical protein KSE_71070 [Kitasatospora setae KM-6054]
MTFFRDLTPYTYRFEDTVSGGRGFASFVPAGRRLNVGWLDGWHRYPKGPSPEDFRTRLLDLVREQRVNVMRGFYNCQRPGCLRTLGCQPTIEHAGETLHLGNCEIRVPGRSDELYAAPNLIAHYVLHHRYLPPAAFVDAVLACPEGWLTGTDAPGVPADARIIDTAALERPAAGEPRPRPW